MGDGGLQCRQCGWWISGDVTLDVVDSIKERCLQWIGRERKLTLILNTNTKPKLILKMTRL